MEVIEQLFPFVYLIALGAVVFIAVMSGVALRSLISLINDLVIRNERIVGFVSAMNDRNTREHNEIIKTIERLIEQHNEAIKAIECLTEKIKAMVGERAYQAGGDD